MNNNERRSAVRVPLNLKINLKNETKNITTSAYNISEAGFYCSLDTKLEINEAFEIEIALMPNSKDQNPELIKCHGYIIRVKENKNDIFKTAVHFTDITEDNLKSIKNCLTGYTSPF